MYRRVPPFDFMWKKMVNVFQKEMPKRPTQDLSNIERNKVMKNQPIQGIP